MSDEARIAIQSRLPIFDDEEPEVEIIKFSGDFPMLLGDEPTRKNSTNYFLVRTYNDEVTMKTVDDQEQRIPKVKVVAGVKIDKQAGEHLMEEWRAERMTRIQERGTQAGLDLSPENLEKLRDQVDKIAPDGSGITDVTIKAGDNVVHLRSSTEDDGTPLPAGWSKRLDGRYVDPDGEIHDTLPEED